MNQPVATGPGGVSLVHAALDVGLTPSLLAEQRRLLGLVLAGEPTERCLVEVCVGVESLNPALRAAIVVLDAAGERVSRVIAPTMSSVVPPLRDATASGWMQDGMDARSRHMAGVGGSSMGRVDDAWGELARSHGLEGGFAVPMLVRDAATGAETGDPGSLVGCVFIGISGSHQAGEDDRRIGEMAAGVAGLLVQRFRSAAPSALYTTIQAEETRVLVSEERYRSLARATSSIVWTTDTRGRFVEPQPSWSDYTGQQWESMVRDGGGVMVHPDDRERVRAEFEAASRSGAPYCSQGRLWHAGTGTYRRFESRGVPLLDSDGSVREWIGMCQDVEEREQAQEALRLNEIRYRAIVESQSEMVCRFGADGTIVFANGAYARVRGVRPEALVGTNLWDFIHGQDRTQVAAQLAQITPDKPEVRIENRVDTDQGTRWTLWTNRGLEFDRRGFPVELQSTGIDITERKLMENALRESEERFRVMANAAPVKIWISGTDRQFTWFNKRWLDFVGRPMEHELGEGWTQNVHPDDLGSVREALDRAFVHRRMFSLEYRLRRRDGEYRWLIDQGVPTYDARGEFAGFIGSALDINARQLAEQDRERHNLELEALVEQRTRELQETFDRLRMSERLVMMGTLSAGLGHDMGNLLLPMRIRLDSLAAHVTSEQAREDLEAIGTASEYLRRLASGLRLLAIDPGRPATTPATNLRAWWDEAEGVLRSVLPQGVSMEFDLPAGVPDVAISKAGLTQIIFNLVQNAGDATRDRASGTVRITARAAEVRVVLSVIDDGPGMTPEVRARCMEPFYTTKKRGISTGLGLALVYSLMREAGGGVELESQVGVGTTFRLSLPVNPAAHTHPPTAGKRAAVKIRDPRMRSFVLGELKAMGVASVDDAGQGTGELLLVVDDPARLADVPCGASAICLGGESGERREGVLCLPANPGILSVRNALRDWVRSARPTTASGTGE